VKTLVISTHPDDETLGCAGTLLKHKRDGDDVHWLIATSTHTPAWSETTIATKNDEVHAVSAAYGMDSVSKLDFPAAMLDTIPVAEIINAIGDLTAKIRPDTVYLVHGGDVHSDHRIVFDTTMSAIKAFNMKDVGVRRILSFETLSSTEAAPQTPTSTFLPNVFVDISDYIDKKLDIMGLFETETQDDPLPRGPSAIRALARYRGASIGVEYAEAFMLIREII